jgi:hypothetical protein
VYDGGTGVVIATRATQSVKGSTNPEYGFTGMVFNYNPIDGSINTHAETAVTIKNSSGSAATRSTS